MPTKSTKSAGRTKPSPATAGKGMTAPRQRTPTSAGEPQPDHSRIAERAYFIHLEEGRSDELENWLRAERELKAA
jgi:hypothetical protein